MDSSEMTICITGAAGHIAISFYMLLGSGYVFGPRISMKLRLLELPEKLNELQGIKMQIEDCNFPLINSIECTADAAVAFKDIDVGIFLGGFPRKPGMERTDLLQINNQIFKYQGQLLQEHAKATAKILVVANPSNTNCLTLAESCPKIPKKNFTSLMKLDENRAKFLLARKAQVKVDQVQKVVIWGNHSLSQYPDVSNATISGTPVKEVVTDHQFLSNELVTSTQKRGSQILQVSKQTSFLSAACAIRDHLKEWHSGTPEGMWSSMGVISDGEHYGIPKGFCFSMPVRCKDFDYEIVPDIVVDDFLRKKLDISLKELANEKEEAHID